MAKRFSFCLISAASLALIFAGCAGQTVLNAEVQARLSAITSLVILVVGFLAIYTMARLQGGKPVTNPRRLVRLHKTFGYIFTVLFLCMFTYMVWRLPDYWEESSARIAYHAALALSAFAMLTFKVAVPRYFPRLNGYLFWTGTVLYTLVFALVGVSGGYYILWNVKGKQYNISHVPKSSVLDENLGKQLLVMKCSGCHVLDSILRPRSEEAWGTVVEDMVVLAAPRITADEGRQILYYLSMKHTPRKPPAQPGAGILEQHCLPCHKATEIFKAHHSKEEWIAIVKQMNQNAPDIVPLDKVEEIADYLSRTQHNHTPPPEQK